MRPHLRPVRDLSRYDRNRLAVAFMTLAAIATAAFVTVVVVVGWRQAFIGAGAALAGIAGIAALLTIMDAYVR